MFRYLLSCLIVLTVVLASAGLFFPAYWEHRYDELIARQARVYRLDEKLVWSLIYEETWFRAWKIGGDAEVGLMQVTPTVAREWAKETGFKEFELQAAENVNEFLADPERNIQAGCWYLEKLRERYRGQPRRNLNDAGRLQRRPEPRRGMDQRHRHHKTLRTRIRRTHRHLVNQILRLLDPRPLSKKLGRG